MTFFLWAIGITGTLIAIIVSVSIYFSYQSIADIKREIREDVKNSKENSDKLLSTTNTSVNSEIKNIKDEMNYTIANSENKINNEVSTIKSNASEIALNEARERVNNAFRENNLQEFISNTAKKEFGDKIKNLTDAEIVKLKKSFQVIPFLSFCLDGIRWGSKKALMSVDSIRRNSSDSMIRDIANNLYELKAADYEKDISEDFTFNKKDSSFIRESNIADYGVNKMTVQQLYKRLKESDNLIEVCIDIIALKYRTGVNFKMFDFDSIDKYFQKHKK